MACKSAYAKFVALNFIVIAIALFLGLPGRDTGGFLVRALIMVVPVLLCQYPILVRFKSWALKSLIFLLGMLVFLFLFGLSLFWNEQVGGMPAGSLVARLDGALRTVYFGTLLGIWFYPAVVIVNWLVRRQLFPDTR